jgi:ribosomal protein S6
MPLYEHVFLARQDLAQAQVDAIAENATTIIKDNGGSVAKTEPGAFAASPTGSPRTARPIT